MSSSLIQHVASLYTQKKYAEALRFIDEKLAQGERDPLLLNIAGVSALTLRQVQDAERYWKEALVLKADYGEVYFNLGNLYRDQGQLAEVETYYRAALTYSPDRAEICNNLAGLLFDQGRYGEAEALYQKALELQPNYPDVYNNLGVLYKTIEKLDSSEFCYHKAITIKPDYVAAYSNLGRLYNDVDRFDAAELCFKKSISIAPQLAATYFNLGIVYARQNRRVESEAVYLKAIELDPGYADACGNLANLYFEWGRLDEAEIYYRRAVDLRPSFYQMLGNLANLYSKFKRYAEAEALYHQVLAMAPGYAEAYFNYANMLSGLKRMDEAEAHYRKSIDLSPKFPTAHFNYGNLLHALKRFDEAEACFKQTLLLKPDYAECYSNYANLLVDLGRFDEAEPYHHKAISLNPNFAEAYSNFGVFHKKLKHLALAEDYFRQALAIKPDCPEMEFNLSLLALVQQRFPEGWQLYESRYDRRMGAPVAYTPNVSFPQWRGESLQGKSIMFWHEQGFGDVIQFARYIPLLKAQGAKHITYVTKKPLKPLFETLQGVDQVVNFEDRHSLTAHDYWTLPLSVPLILKTDLDTIPSDVGYIAALPDKKRKWKKKLPASGFKVGVVWKGSTEHTGDAMRSLSSVEVLKPLWAVPGVTFISLQKGQGEEEALSPPIDQPLLHVGQDIEDFSDTAAIVDELDLVISIDTALVHLAGALGKPVWVLIPYVPDWRWMLDREDSPWYPTMRLFRQKELMRWEPVVEQLALELAAVVQKAKKPGRRM